MRQINELRGALVGKQVNFYMDYQIECRFVELVLNSGGQILNTDKDVLSSLECLPEGINMYMYLYKQEFGPLVYRENKLDIFLSRLLNLQGRLCGQNHRKALIGEDCGSK